MIGSGVGGIKSVIDGFLEKGIGPTDQWTNGRMDRPSNRDAWTHLETIGSDAEGIVLMIDGFLEKGNGLTDWHTLL